MQPVYQSVCLSYDLHKIKLILTQSQINYKVIRVIDGDTFQILYEDQITSVQLVGVTTLLKQQRILNQPPEPYGEQATASLREFLLDKSIYLRFDV